LCFPILPGSAEAQVICGSIVKHLLIAHFVGNMSAKQHQNPFVRVKSYSKLKVGRFLRHAVQCGPMPNVMVALPNSAQRRKVLLAPTAPVPCSNATKIGECKTWRMQSEFCTWQNSVTGQEPPKMYMQCTSPRDGQTPCKVWLASVEQRRCSNAAKTRKPLKFAGVPQSTGPISVASGPKMATLVPSIDISIGVYRVKAASVHSNRLRAKL